MALIGAIGAAVSAAAKASAARKKATVKKGTATVAKKTGSSSGSGGSSSGSLNYNRGNEYTNRETAFTWNDNGVNKTTYSKSNNWQDALAEGISKGYISSGAKLQTGVSYGVGNTAGGASTRKGSGGSSLEPSRNADGSYAYAEALAKEAAANSKNNPLNEGKQLSGYNAAMNDFYNYYNGLTEGQRKSFAEEQNKKQTWNLYDAVESLKNGYVPVKTSSSTAGKTPEMNGQMFALKQTQDALKNQYGAAGSAMAQNIAANPYGEDYLKNIQSRYDSQADMIRDLYAQYADADAKRLENNRSSINEKYDDAAKQAYLQYQVQNANLGGQLAASGITGGASETARLGLGNTYAANVTGINKEKASANKDLDNSIADVYSKYNLTAGEKLLQNSSAALDAYQNYIDKQIDWNKWASEFARNNYESDRNYNYQVGRDNVSDMRYDKEWNYQVEQDNYKKQQEAWETAIEYAAQYGDYTRLKNLGGTSLADAIKKKNDIEDKLQQLEIESKQLGLKSDQLAYQQKVNNISSGGGSGKSVTKKRKTKTKKKTKEETKTTKEPNYYSTLDEYLGGNRANGRFDSAEGLYYGANYVLEKKLKDKVSTDEYNNWAKARGYAML